MERITKDLTVEQLLEMAKAPETLRALLDSCYSDEKKLTRMRSHLSKIKISWDDEGRVKLLWIDAQEHIKRFRELARAYDGDLCIVTMVMRGYASEVTIPMCVFPRDDVVKAFPDIDWMLDSPMCNLYVANAASVRNCTSKLAMIGIMNDPYMLYECGKQMPCSSETATASGTPMEGIGAPGERNGGANGNSDATAEGGADPSTIPIRVFGDLKEIIGDLDNITLIPTYMFEWYGFLVQASRMFAGRSSSRGPGCKANHERPPAQITTAPPLVDLSPPTAGQEAKAAHQEAKAEPVPTPTVAMVITSPPDNPYGDMIDKFGAVRL